MRDGGTVLEVGGGGGENLDALRRLGRDRWRVEGLEPDRDPARGDMARYDLIILTHALERSRRPVRQLEGLSALLRPEGRLVVVVNNPGSPSFSLFGGRHWAGYRFPQHCQVLGLHAVEVLGERAGLRLRSFATLPNPQLWHRSALQVLADWRARPSILRDRTATTLGLGLVARAVETISQRFGRGALLTVVLEGCP